MQRKRLALQGCVSTAGAEIHGRVFWFQGVHVQVKGGVLWAVRPEATRNRLISSAVFVVTGEHELRWLLSTLFIPVHSIMSQILFTSQRSLISGSQDQVSGCLSNSSVHRDCQEKRTKFRQSPEGRVGCSQGFSIEGQPMSTQDSPAPRRQRTAGQSTPRHMAEAGQSGLNKLGCPGQGGWSLVSSSLVGGFACDVTAPECLQPQSPFIPGGDSFFFPCRISERRWI